MTRRRRRRRRQRVFGGKNPEYDLHAKVQIAFKAHSRPADRGLLSVPGQVRDRIHARPVPSL